jgi:hypothetical protein
MVCHNPLKIRGHDQNCSPLLALCLAYFGWQAFTHRPPNRGKDRFHNRLMIIPPLRIALQWGEGRGEVALGFIWNDAVGNGLLPKRSCDASSQKGAGAALVASDCGVFYARLPRGVKGS